MSFTAVPRVAVDSLGTEIPGGLHIARYGGGGAYAAVDPLLSAWLDGNPLESRQWRISSRLFRETTVASLELDGHRAEFEKALRTVSPVRHVGLTRLHVARAALPTDFNVFLGGAHNAFCVVAWLADRGRR